MKNNGIKIGKKHCARFKSPLYYAIKIGRDVIISALLSAVILGLMSLYFNPAFTIID